MQSYRNLTKSEINLLEMQSCRAEDWQTVSVVPDFRPDRIRNCAFRGDVRLGKDVYICNIGSCIANCEIGDGAYIENVSVIEATGQSCFGNGTPVAVINEGGGREVPLSAVLTAQTAYINAMYRHRFRTMERLAEMTQQYCRETSSAICRIGAGTRVTNSGIIRNVNIGDAAIVEGVTILFNGTVVSSPGAPAIIGAGVRMYDFIVRGSSVTDGGASLKRCFVGEGVKICGLTATDSLFFANSHFENGEVCSIFAGPFTVSHHKSSLLIAGMFSFFNAGSGSNQSNHLFKTGAVHQGVHRRGCKFGSDAYIVLPARNGAFNIVIGRHKNHHDTEDFPYSYLVEDNGQSYLVPGMNLTNYGTVRDLQKWRRRDSRGASREDVINFEEHNPYITERILRGINVSRELLGDEGPDEYYWSRVKMRSTALSRGIRLYELAQDKFIGAMLADGRGQAPAVDEAEYRGPWLDVAGMYVTKRAVDAIMDDMDSGAIATLDEFKGRFAELASRYTSNAFAWALDVLEQELGHAPSDDEVAAAIERGEQAAAELTRLAEEDREKDFTQLMATGYGVDSHDMDEIMADFRTVRGI